LLDALDDPQRKQATLNYRVGDLVLGPNRKSHSTRGPESIGDE
jgi:hypothetical protein